MNENAVDKFYWIGQKLLLFQILTWFSDPSLWGEREGGGGGGRGGNCPTGPVEPDKSSLWMDIEFL